MGVVLVTREIKDGATEIIFASDSTLLDGLHHPSGGTKVAPKIIKTETLTIGCAGSHQDFVLLNEFVQISKPLKKASVSAVIRFFLSFSSWMYDDFSRLISEESRFLLAFQDRVFRCEPENQVYEVDEFDAIGSGEDYVRAALFLGQSPEQAIRVACELSEDCFWPTQIVKHQVMQ